MKSFNPHKIIYTLVVVLLLLIASCAKDTNAVPDYTGSWTCAETTSNPAGTTSFTIHLKKTTTTSTNDYYMENIYNLGFSVQGAVNITNNTITISQQSIGAGNSAFNVSGTGSVVSATKLSLTYKINDGSGNVDNCTANLTKQ